jgi:hypothetical protein
MNIKDRIAIEHKIARFLVRTMKKHGWLVYAVDDGEEFNHMSKEKDVLALVFDLDEAVIHFENKALPIKREDGTMDCAGHGVKLVFGNDGYDLIADWSYSEDPKDNFNKIMEEEVGKYTDAIEEKVYR